MHDGCRVIPKSWHVISPAGALLLALLALVGCSAARSGEGHSVVMQAQTRPTIADDWPVGSLEGSFDGKIMQQLFAGSTTARTKISTASCS